MHNRKSNINADHGPVNVRLYSRDRANVIVIRNFIRIHGLVSGEPTVSDAIRWAIEQACQRIRYDLMEKYSNANRPTIN